MKKTILIFLFVAIAVVLVAGVVPVYAHGHGGGRGSIWIGPGWGPGWGMGWGPWWGGPYYYPYYYAAPPVVIERQPPVYEQYEQQAPQPQEQPYYWYFCPDAKAYYPYVKQCPGGWMKVIPSKPDKGGE